MTCFEGMKAYHGADGRTRLFRPELNMARLRRSARRLQLADFCPQVGGGAPCLASPCLPGPGPCCRLPDAAGWPARRALMQGMQLMRACRAARAAAHWRFPPACLLALHLCRSCWPA